MKTIISFLVAMAMSASILPNKIFSNQSPPQQDLRSCGVTVYITLSTSLDPTGTIVTFNGIIDTVTSSNNPLVYDIGTPGLVEITAFKIGYEFYKSGPDYCNCDKVFNVALSEIKYPPTRLKVDSVILKATWSEPLRTALDEDFENPVFPPAGWQALSHEDGWFRTNDGNNGNWTIPEWDSYYAVTIAGNDGCCDYLITPAVDLRESEGYVLTFNSYYDGTWNQLAFIEYSLDGGDTWAVICQLDPAYQWTDTEIDLSPFSGPAGPAQVWFAFHANNAGGSASGWAIDNVRIAVPAPSADYLDFWVFLDDSLVGVTTSANWDYAPLLYGQSFTASVAARYSSGLSSKDYYSFTCNYLFPADSLTGIAPDDAAILQWYPPWELPENLLGYNVYRNGAFIAYTPQEQPGEYMPQGYVDEDLWPGHYDYTITAVYDLTPYGYPGDTAESMEEGPATLTSQSCFDLEFQETWATGNFEVNLWTTNNDNWLVNSQAGNPSPAAEFTGEPALTDYEASLISYPLCAEGMTEGKIWLDFDLKLDALQPTGEELLQVQIWNWESEEWATEVQYSNSEGSFDWTSKHINIKSQSMDQIFKIRFQAKGVNSASILGWFIDNIDVYRVCDGPTNLQANAIANVGIVLSCEWPQGDTIDEWIHWDDGDYSGNSFGSGGQAQWDVAARWEPDQLAGFEGASVKQIAFIPTEPAAVYRVRVWVGAEAQNLVVDQPVTPVCGQWNTVTLINPVPIDVTQVLWIGYHVDTPSGFPAGGDNGPAIDGYGNMINFGGWQTLLQMNPELDYNWNIAAHLVTVAGVSVPISNGAREIEGYNIYRNAGGAGYVLMDYSPEPFIDPIEGLIPGTLYCYMVTAVYASETDQCESGFSNEACVLWTVIDDDNQKTNYLNLYPNPADDRIYINSSDELKRISVYDETGRLIKDEIVQGMHCKLNTTTYGIGVYLIRVESAAGMSTRVLTIRR